MADYVISCCSTSDLNQEHYVKRNIKVAYFHYEIDGKPYLDDGEYPIAEFYKAMAAGAMTKTSQINVDEYIAHFEQYLKAGNDIIHLTLSSGISGTINSANVAANELREKYPDRKLYIIDSLAASSGYGLLMDKIADLRDEGRSIEEVKSWVIENRLYLNHWFFTTDLTYFVRGGRITKAAGWVGGALKICPLLDVDKEGKLVPRTKHRGKENVIHAAAQKMLENANGGAEYADKCYISQSACMDDAKKLIREIEALVPAMKGKIEIYDVGTTIGSHTGPGTVALFFWGKKRED